MNAIISMHTPDYQVLADYTWTNNKLEYALRHGYDTYCKTEGFTLAAPGPIAAEKLFAIREYLDSHPNTDWVWWIDTDAIITNYNIKIEDLVDNDYHFIIGADGNGLNAGVFFLRNSPEGNAYLNWMIEVWPKYQTHHFYEQQIMIESYDMPEWNPIMKVVPQNRFNSHDCWPNKVGVDKFGERGWWEPGDVVVHWPGSSLKTRLERQIPTYMPRVIK